MSTETNNEQGLATITPKDLAYLSELEQQISQYEEEYKDLVIHGVDDEEGYQKVYAALRTLQPIRTKLDQERKDMGKPYAEVVSFINGKYKAVTEKIQKIESPLKGERQKIDDAKKEIEAEKERLAEQKINNRVNALINAGASFDNSYYSIEGKELGISETSIGVVEIRTMTDELFEQFLQIVLDKAAKISAEKERLEKVAKQQQEEKDAADKKEREEFKAAQDKLAAQQKEFDDRQVALQKENDGKAAELKAAQDKINYDKQQAEQNRLREIIQHRTAILTGMGLALNTPDLSFRYENEPVVTDDISAINDTEWQALIDTTAKVVKEKKDAAAAFLKQQEAEEKQRGIDLEKERLADLNDKEKIKEYTTALLGVYVPPLKAAKWRKIADGIRDYITDQSAYYL